MDCPTCGYVLDPFEPECPRCKRLGDKAAPAPAPAPDTEKVRTIAREYATRPTPKDKDEVETELHVGYEPALGWPLTLILWTLALLQLGLIFYHFIVTGYFFTASSYAMREVATFGLLYCQRWAFRLFATISVVPALIALMVWDGSLNDLINLVVLVIPAILVFVLGYAKIDELE